MKNLFKLFLLILCLITKKNSTAQNDERLQYPFLLKNTYFEINVGYINYPFGQQHLEPGFVAGNIKIPHAAVRIVFGHSFNPYFAAQISYMRPINWVEYYDIISNNTDKDPFRSVWMNIGGFTLKGELPLKKHWTIYAEGGLAVVTRSGCKSWFRNEADIVKNANYASIEVGAGLKYVINPNWALQLSSLYSPENKTNKQPSTSFIGLGFTYNLHKVSEERIEEKRNAGYFFPRNMIQIGFTTNEFGYRINEFVSEGKIPIFWGGMAQVKYGFALHYQRNVFHGKKIFSFDWGASYTYCITRNNNEKFFALSVYPLFRWTILRLKSFDWFLNYSLAGPTYLSRAPQIEGYNTGPNFTFQDFMGTGFYFGKTRNYNIDIRIGHYSNGNIFPYNYGVMIPLTFHFGYTF